jgi:hypothetical protein
MMDLLFNGVVWTDIALAMNRIYAFMLIMVISAGAGPYSLDVVILGLIDKDVV